MTHAQDLIRGSNRAYFCQPRILFCISSLVRRKREPHQVHPPSHQDDHEFSYSCYYYYYAYHFNVHPPENHEGVPSEGLWGH